MARIPVIDGDGHVMERPGEIMDFIEGPWEGPTSGLINSPFPSLDGAHINASRAHGRKEKVSGTDAVVWREFMDFAGIDEAVLYPTAALSLGLIHNPDWAAKAARGYNLWLHETHLKPEPRLHAPGVLPTQDVSAAVEELRYCVKNLGMVGEPRARTESWKKIGGALPRFPDRPD